MAMLITGVADEFTWAYMFVALVPFAFFFKMQKRERAWIISLTAMYLCTGVLLIMLLNPTLDRASADLIRVFLTSSHLIVACLIGYGLGLTAAFMATNYPRFRWWGMIGGAIGVLLALYCLWDATGKNYFGRAGWPDFWASFGQWPHWVVRAFAKNQFGLPVFANLLLVALALAFVFALLIYRRRGPLLITLVLFTLMPAYSVLDHWFDSEQRNHWFGYWFGHDMFTPPFNGKEGKPIYPQMTKDAILFGGTDPGRFCPEYMIYCESFTPHNCQPAQDQKYDRRDVYIITQNALADGTYLCFIRSHYNRSTQIDPPFFSELARTFLKDNQYQTNLLAQAVRPLDRFFTELGARVEKRRRTYTSWFTERDFTDLPALAAKLHVQQDPLSKYIYDHCAAQTQQLLSGKADNPALGRSLANDLNQLMDRDLQIKEQLAAKQQAKEDVDLKIADGNSSERLRGKQQQLAREIAELLKVQPLYEPDRFKEVAISEYLADFIKENPQSHTRIRLNRLLLEAAYPKEIAKSIGGVYPDREISTPTPDDSRLCFEEYYADAGRRLQHDMQFPNEPRQVKPGENVTPIAVNGQTQIQVSGNVAVMSLNGLLTKVIFDHNPKSEFFVEESFPLDWMYPYLTPFGVIMKINRQPLPAFTDDILQKDHDFWKQYSKRLTGDIMDYDTPVKDVVAWIEKTYLRRDFNGFTGDRKFIRDDDAQKAFSKLRSSIGGIYAWRLGGQCPPEYRPKSDAEAQRLLREADFTFKQSFAFCPYSPEAVWRYASLLSQFQRFDDAILIAETCLKLDPFNSSVLGLLDDLRRYKESAGGIEQVRTNLHRLEEEVQGNPANFEAALQLADAYRQMQQTARANQLLDAVLINPKLDATNALRAAQVYAQMGNWAKLESALEKVVVIDPSSPEGWYNLAALRATLGKKDESLAALRRTLEINVQRLKRDPKAPDLAARIREDQHFDPIKQTPEFQKLLAPK
jgi:tetratricopeptide (TPR) repeat protein